MAHDHMSDLEAMMWNVEQDPWLAPNGGSITVYDRELDLDVFRRSVRRAVVDLDGPLILARDRPGGLNYSASVVSPPAPTFWG